MKLAPVERINEGMHVLADTFGKLLLEGFHYVGLFAIGATIVWSAALTFREMLGTGSASVHDILLLFIYLELGAMVGIYFKTNHMPVRFLIYVAMTALTRTLIGDVQQEQNEGVGIVLISGAILLLALATLVIRFASFKFPSAPGDARS